jgi:hypothetical protein
VDRKELPIDHYYSAYPGASAKTVRVTLELARRLEAFAARARNSTPQQFEASYRAFLKDVQSIRDPRPPRDGRSTKMISVLTAVETGRRGRLQADLRLLAHAPVPVPTDCTHFARWVLVEHLDPPPRMAQEDRSYLLFSAWFDPSPEEYLVLLHDRLGDRAERIWGHCGLRRSGAEAFREHLLRNRIEVGSSFPGYDGVTVGEVREALDVSERLEDFAVNHQESDPQTLHQDWLRAFA